MVTSESGDELTRLASGVNIMGGGEVVMRHFRVTVRVS